MCAYARVCVCACLAENGNKYPTGNKMHDEIDQQFAVCKGLLKCCSSCPLYQIWPLDIRIQWV